MRYIIVSVYDRAADAFMRPMFVNAVGQAVRIFTDEINRVADDNAMYKHPDDFDLFELGTFDEDMGRFENLEGGGKQIAIGKNVSMKVKDGDSDAKAERVHGEYVREVRRVS